VRLACTPDATHTLWGAVSKAVRTPSRFDVDITAFNLAEHPGFVSEEVIAFEAGYRWRPFEKVSLSLATYYNQYTELRTLNLNEGPAVFYFGNDMDANTYGFEVSGNVLVSDWWRLRGGYTYLHKKFTITGDNVVEGTELIEGIDPANQLLIQSNMDIGQNFELDIVTRYVDQLPAVALTNTPAVPSYVNMNMRLAYEYKFMTFSVGGQNLLYEKRTEFGTRQIPRNLYANVTVRL
jgi:iron complex outermembrane receptor protein